MMDLDWEMPVSVQLGGPGDHDLIFCTRDAVACLLDDWPVDDGDRFHAALQTFMLVMDGRAEPDETRSAFIAAAREAGVVVVD